jgi:hypothetical protein
MGRLWQLRQTLEEHLRVFSGQRDIELVLLDYNSPDGLEEWIRTYPAAQRALYAGLLVYVKVHDVTAYSSPKAKNLAHRMARGEVLVNLDADNWASGIDDAMREEFSHSRDVFVHAFNRNHDGSYGRIGIAREWFYRLGGYDESFEPMGYQDEDLINRARAAGLQRVPFVCGRLPLRNEPWQKIAFTGSQRPWIEMWETNKATSQEKVLRGELTANRSGWGTGLVSVNFGRPQSLLPEIPANPVPVAVSLDALEDIAIGTPPWARPEIDSRTTPAASIQPPRERRRVRR